MRPHYSTTQGPCAEPVTYDEVADHVRVDSTDDREYLTGLIEVAREYVSNITGRVFSQETITLTGSTWACLSKDRLGFIPLERTPLVSVSSVKYYAPDGTSLSTLATTEYRVITTSAPGMIQVHGSLPSVHDRPDAIQIEFLTGKPASTSAGLKHAVKMMAAHLYENRLPVAFASCESIPYTLQALIDNEKVGGFS